MVKDRQVKRLWQVLSSVRMRTTFGTRLEWTESSHIADSIDRRSVAMVRISVAIECSNWGSK